MSRLITIDGMRFSRSMSTLARSIGEKHLPRLAEFGCRSAKLKYDMSGATNDAGRPCLILELSGKLELTCQRCLKPMPWAIVSRAELELVTSLESIDNAIDDRDRVLASKEMDIDGLVEDEIILAIPMIPRHEVCSVAGAEVASEVQSPFGVLASLKRGPVR